MYFKFTVLFAIVLFCGTATVCCAQGMLNQGNPANGTAPLMLPPGNQLKSQALIGAESMAAGVPPVRPVPAPNPYVVPARRPLAVSEVSYIYLEEQPPREIQVHDIITILVDHKSELTANSRFNRQRNQSFQAELAEFIRLDDDKTLRNSASTSPAIDVSQQGRIQSTGTLKDSEGIRYHIAATVVSVLPNGNLVLEARKSVHTRDDSWEYRLAGTIHSEKVASDLTALSEDIANLRIERSQKGRIYDSTKRGWGTKLLDFFWPF
ncbi:flagellar basal body L-ring protein FlgH [Calycomorphotria hydatis]|uniref:Flagellar L-ring protein n=1 Tax=Calycomorphotria hydatis TaxID=2528027 RepID=A0A517TCN1_9PLAN|nr:flagellar basal body L-ring protein FlgH [Calycomorphotria hydatis]QDT66133.1 Flagellar L-ring protein precursor [Calycomorphotria hydatis]